jgi:pyruvate carboxylase
MIVPYKRRLGKARDGAITPTVVALYANALKLRIHRHRSDEDREATNEAENAVDRALSIRLWQTSVFDVDVYRQPGDPDWERAAELRRQLDVALRTQREAVV